MNIPFGKFYGKTNILGFFMQNVTPLILAFRFLFPKLAHNLVIPGNFISSDDMI